MLSAIIEIHVADVVRMNGRQSSRFYRTHTQKTASVRLREITNTAKNKTIKYLQNKRRLFTLKSYTGSYLSVERNTRISVPLSLEATFCLQKCKQNLHLGVTCITVDVDLSSREVQNYILHICLVSRNISFYIKMYFQLLFRQNVVLRQLLLDMLVKVCNMFFHVSTIVGSLVGGNLVYM